MKGSKRYEWKIRLSMSYYDWIETSWYMIRNNNNNDKQNNGIIGWLDSFVQWWLRWLNFILNVFDFHAHDLTSRFWWDAMKWFVEVYVFVRNLMMIIKIKISDWCSVTGCSFLGCMITVHGMKFIRWMRVSCGI